jgi:hypothetical protein
MMNIEDVGFPGFGLQGKYLCVMCVFSIVSFCYFIEKVFTIKYCTRLKSIFGIRAIIGFRGTPFWSGILLGTVIILQRFYRRE